MSDAWRVNPDALRRLGMTLSEDAGLSAICSKLHETAGALAVSGGEGAAMRSRLFALADTISRQRNNTAALGESLAGIVSCYEQAEEEALSYIRAAASGQDQPEDAGTGGVSCGGGAESAAPAPGVSEAELPQRCGYDPAAGEYSSDPVHLCTGNLVWQETDAAFLCGTRLRVRRTYNSHRREAGWFGTGWTCEWEERLLFSGRQITGICLGDGHVVPPQGSQGHLERSGDGYCFSIPGGEAHFFSADGLLRRVRTAGKEELRFCRSGDERELLITYQSSAGADRGQITVRFLETGCISDISSPEDPDAEDASALCLAYRYEEQNGHPVLSRVLRNDKLLRRYEYDDAVLLRAIRTGAGALLAENRFDAWGRCVGQRFADDTGISYRYAEGENRTDVIERTGEAVSCEYDSRGRKLAAARGGRQILYTYDAAGGIRTVTYEDGGTLRCLRTAQARLHQIQFRPSREEQRDTSIRSFEKNRILTLHAASGKTRFRMNASGALREVSYPSGKSYRLTYDDAGQLASITQNGKTLCEYQRTGAGELCAIREAGGTSSYRYDAHGRLRWLTDRYGAQFRFSYSLSDVTQASLLTELRHQGAHADDAVISFQYGANDALTGISCRDSSGTLLSREFERDSSGRITAICIDGVREERTVCEQERAVTQSFSGPYEQDAQFPVKKIRHVFSSRGTVARRDVCDETGEETMVAAYDSANLISSLTCSDGTYTWKRDVLGRTLQETRPDGIKIRRAFASCGKIASRHIALPGAQGSLETIWRYDRLANPVSVTELGKTVSDTYTEHKLIRRVFPNGICSVFFYDDQGRIAGVSHQKGDQDALQVSYEYDEYHRITMRRVRIPVCWRKSNPVTITSRYTYDTGRTLAVESITREEAGQSSETTITDRYDAAGNRRQRRVERTDGTIRTIRYAYDENSRLQTVMSEGMEEQSFSYDVMGNVRRIGKSGDPEVLLQYSPLGELREIRNGHNGNGQTPKTERVYDPFGCVRLSKKDGDVIQNLYDTNQYPPRLTGRTYQGSQCWYLWDTLPVLMHLKEETFSYLTDGMGRLLAVTDQHGDVAEWFLQDAFGEDLPFLGEMGASVPMPYWRILQPFTFTGMERDPYTSWYHTHFREYDPAIGRFFSPDRCDAISKLPRVWNRYSFCFSDPVNLRDPDGRWPNWPSLSDIGQGLVSAGEWFADGATTILNTICGANQTVYQIDVNGVTYSVTEHTGGSVLVSNYDQYGNYTGWAVNASVKIPFTDISLKTSMSGDSLNPFTWGIKQSIKFGAGDGEVSSYTQYALALGQNGISWQAESGGGYASMPTPLPDGTNVSSHTDLGWALSLKQGGISWYQMAMAAACAGAVAAIAVLALDDETGIGVLDDGLIPVLTAFLAEHAIVLGDVIPAFALPVCAGG